MSVGRDDEAEKQARDQLEFYGFWLWNYTHNEFVDFEDNDDEVEKEYYSHSDKVIQCDILCQDRRYCFMCPTVFSEKKNNFIQAIFTSGTNITHEDMENGRKIRLTGDEVIQYYYAKKLDDSVLPAPNTGFKYIPKSERLSFEVVNIEETVLGSQNVRLTSKKELTVKIDLSIPFDIIRSELEELYYLENEKALLHFKQPDSTLEISLSHQTYYRSVLKNLKTYNEISFSASAYEARALGFWLWDTVRNKKLFGTVPQAVEFLKSGKQFPKDLLSRFGFEASEPAVFNRLCRLTGVCIKKKEVCSIG